MALNPDRIAFLLTQIHRIETRMIRSSVSQLFSYLTNEIKDNPVYDKYENEKEKWINWPNPDETNYAHGELSLPDTLEETKSLAYDIYKRISQNDYDWIADFSADIFWEKGISANIDILNSTFIGYFEQVLEDIINANPEIEVNSPQRVNNRTAFIIHGHDNEIKTELQLLLNRAGVNSVVLHEQADRGRTIIDKLIEETKTAGYAIALLTPDDLTKGGNNRARQNVILEIGYFLGKLGKERIRMVVKGDIEIPSDLHGILYEKHDFSGAWKIKLLKELQAVGIYVDIKAAVSEF